MLSENVMRAFGVGVRASSVISLRQNEYWRAIPLPLNSIRLAP